MSSQVFRELESQLLARFVRAQGVDPARVIFDVATMEETDEGIYYNYITGSDQALGLPDPSRGVERRLLKNDIRRG